MSRYLHRNSKLSQNIILNHLRAIYKALITKFGWNIYKKATTTFNWYYSQTNIENTSL